MVNRSRFSSALTSIPGCPLVVDSGNRTFQALNPKHDSRVDGCPGYLVARSLCQ